MFVAPAYAQTAGEPAEPAETLSETGVPGDAGHGGGFPPFDASTYPSQLLWLAITFGLFYLFLKRVVLPRIGGILEIRSDRIAHDLDQAARMKEEADAAIAAYEQELADARRKAVQIGNEARDGAKAEADAEQKKVEAGLDLKMADAERRIASIKDAAMKDVGEIAEQTAAALVQELMGAKVDKTTVAAAVREARS
jgi:F-type H+-transporting ATPase subunit b